MSDRLTANKRVPLERQIVVRVDVKMYEQLQADAEENGRTVAQSVRHILRGKLGRR